MKFKQNQSPTPDTIALRGVPFLPGDVTAENYTDKAIAFMRVSGRSNGEHPVVSLDDPDIGPFVAWAAFLASLKRTAFGRQQSASLSRTLRRLTVPSTWPWEFSQDADHLRGELPAMLHAQRRVEPEIGPQRRKQLAMALRGSLPEMRDVGPKKRRDFRDETPSVPPKEWQQGDTTAPSLSPEALSKMGVQRQAEAAE